MCLQHSDPDEEKIIDLKTLKNKKLCKSWFTCGLWEHKDVTQFLSVQIEITHDTVTVTVDLELYWYWGALGDFFFGGRIH